MAGKDNLRPPRSTAEARERGKKGGVASGKARRERKALREELLALLSDGDTQEKVCIALIRQARRGNTRAFEVLRDTVGEKLADIQEVKAQVTVQDDRKAVQDLADRLFGDKKP